MKVPCLYYVLLVAPENNRQGTVSQATAPEDPVGFKPRQPDSFNGKRDFLSVSNWMFKMEQYFYLVGIFKPGILASDETRIMSASLFLTQNAALWWYTLVKSNLAPTKWSMFCEALKREFVRTDYVRRTRDRLRKLKNQISISISFRI